MASYKESLCANMVQNDPTERPVFLLDQGSVNLISSKKNVYFFNMGVLGTYTRCH